MQKVYLDNAATTQVRPEVIEKMQVALTEFYGNPSSTHSYGRSAKTAVEQARKTIAKTLNAKPAEIIFTSGGTEADNMILRCAVRDLDVKTIITSKIEHHAVLHTAEELEKEYGIALQFVDLDAYGNPELDHLKLLLTQDDSKKLVSLMHVNNEIGNIVDIHAIGTLCRNMVPYFIPIRYSPLGIIPGMWKIPRWISSLRRPINFMAPKVWGLHLSGKIQG